MDEKQYQAERAKETETADQLATFEVRLQEMCALTAPILVSITLDKKPAIVIDDNDSTVRIKTHITPITEGAGFDSGGANRYGPGVHATRYFPAVFTLLATIGLLPKDKQPEVKESTIEIEHHGGTRRATEITLVYGNVRDLAQHLNALTPDLDKKIAIPGVSELQESSPTAAGLDLDAAPSRLSRGHTPTT